MPKRLHALQDVQTLAGLTSEDPLGPVTSLFIRPNFEQ
jgi:hypothetical protein